MLVQDPNSSTNHQDIATQHVHLSLKVDFATSTLKGSATWTISRVSGLRNTGDEFLQLDINQLRIHSVSCSLSDKEDELSLTYSLTDFETSDLGQMLKVKLPSSWIEGLLSVKVVYETSPMAGAVQWLTPAQTVGGKHPYMFTQCQAIHARSLFPVQDAPGNKFTYTAEIDVPIGLVACMSALPTSGPELVDGHHRYGFSQPVPIPSYLLAIAAGNLASEKIGERTVVWSEPEMLQRCVDEFGESTEKYLNAAEEICGPYVWGIYGLLVLPPSFPYGGMENPCLTFVTPTLLAGDGSLTAVVAHEIAHSWMGNLVTNATWEHFWLNEGFTMYVERRILARMSCHGEKMRDLSAMLGVEALQRSVDHFGSEHCFTCLIPKLTGVDPDEAFSSVPYEKGFNLLLKLEKLVGGPSEMERYIKAHCERFKFSTIDSFQFRDFFSDFFSDVPGVQAIDWQSVYYTPGLPEFPVLDTSLSDELLKTAAVCFNIAETPNFAPCNAWENSQVLVFLDSVVRKCRSVGNPEECRAILKRIDDFFMFRQSTNSEIRFRWYTVNYFVIVKTH